MIDITHYACWFYLWVPWQLSTLPIFSSGIYVDIYIGTILLCKLSSASAHGFIADFKQIEFRIFAHMTADEQLINILKDDTQDVFKNLTAIW